MNKNIYRDWVMTLDSQSGVVDHSQVQRAGLSKRAVAHRLKSGKWRRMHRGVYATFTGPVQREAKLWAAVRRAGSGAMLSHETAAEVHGLVDKPATKIHITVPANRRPAQHRPIRGVVIHRSDQSLPARLPEWKVPRTRIEDTVLDLVATAKTFDEAYSWISRALSERLATADMLRAALANRRRIRWRTLLNEALSDAEDGIYFPLERRYAHDVERAHGLPKAERQARRTIGGRTHHKDNWYAEYGICVELDGAAYHPPEQIRRDRDRDNVNLWVDDARTYRFTLVDVTEKACESAAMVAASLRRHGWQGRPHPCRRPGCKVGQPG
jgi:Transcriptional regulator, AbiEi antitoxin/AbiEi antitoxin C-terminal domain